MAVPKIKKLLIANRGEIACKIIRCAKKMKIPTKKNRWGYLHGKSRPTLLSTRVYILGQWPLCYSLALVHSICSWLLCAEIECTLDTFILFYK